jgi:hypothetical protein
MKKYSVFSIRYSVFGKFRICDFGLLKVLILDA